MQRISVVGTSGVGKSTLAQAITERMGIDHIELDAIFHDGEWEKLSREEFRTAVTQRCAGDTWVTCGNYKNSVLDIVWARADTVIVLELPRRIVMWRVTKRTPALHVPHVNKRSRHVRSFPPVFAGLRNTCCSSVPQKQWPAGGAAGHWSRLGGRVS